MAKIVFISCASKKLSRRSKAEDLYISPLFRMSLAFAQSFNPKKIFILSAKYGLLDSRQVIDPYEQTLNKMSLDEVKRWAESVKKQLSSKVDFKKDEAIFLAGERYRRHLLPLFLKSNVPLEGMGIGKQLQYLKNKTKYGK